MDKHTLKQYRYCRHRAADLKHEIEMHRQQHSVHDVTTGSQSEFPYIKRTSPVDGCPDSSELASMQLERMRCIRLVQEVETWINTVPDPIVQKAIRLRYMDGAVRPDWSSVANKVRGNSPDGIRMAVTRFLQKK